MGYDVDGDNGWGSGLKGQNVNDGTGGAIVLCYHGSYLWWSVVRCCRGAHGAGGARGMQGRELRGVGQTEEGRCCSVAWRVFRPAGSCAEGLGSEHGRVVPMHQVRQVLLAECPQ